MLFRHSGAAFQLHTVRIERRRLSADQKVYTTRMRSAAGWAAGPLSMVGMPHQSPPHPLDTVGTLFEHHLAECQPGTACRCRKSRQKCRRKLHMLSSQHWAVHQRHTVCRPDHPSQQCPVGTVGMKESSHCMSRAARARTDAACSLKAPRRS